MKSFNEFITEGKQVGTLYHYTSPDAALSIIEKNTLKIGRYGYVSFTRDKNFHSLRNDNAFMKRNEVTTLVSLVIDGNKLSNNYKIIPYTDYEWQYNNPVKSRIYNEQEEIVEKDIKDIKKYIMGIRVHYSPRKDDVEYNQLKALGIKITNGK